MFCFLMLSRIFTEFKNAIVVENHVRIIKFYVVGSTLYKYLSRFTLKLCDK